MIYFLTKKNPVTILVYSLFVVFLKPLYDFSFSLFLIWIYLRVSPIFRAFKKSSKVYEKTK